MWNSIFKVLPNEVDQVWIRVPYFYGSPVLATYSVVTQLFTSVDTGILIPSYYVARWRYV